MHSKLLFVKKNQYLTKNKKDFIGEHCIIYSFLFGLVMCHESQTWSLMAIEKMYVIYFMHIEFIQSSSYNHWIKLWVPKCCHAHSLMFRISKRCHQDFSLLHTYHTHYTSFFWMKNGSPIMCFHLHMDPCIRPWWGTIQGVHFLLVPKLCLRIDQMNRRVHVANKTWNEKLICHLVDHEHI
jgi:hypothetical protein